MTKIFNSVIGLLTWPVVLLMVVCTFIWMYFFPKSYQKFDEKFEEKVDASNELSHYAGCRAKYDNYFRDYLRDVVCNGAMYGVSPGYYKCNPPECVDEFYRIMRKYKYEITKTPTAQIYEAFCIELDPQYRNIVEKVKIGYPLTEEEQAVYDDIHYQA